MADTTDFWKRHAAEWQCPGAMVRDPETGCRFVCYSAQDGVTRWVYCDGLAQGLTHVHPRQSGGDSAVNRAIAAGPVLDDDAMRGILLAWLVRVCWGVLQIRTVTESMDPDVALNLYDARDKALAQAFYGAPGMVIERALRWALTSDDSPVREVK